jgi:sulfur-oxidizing protein SoxX
MAMHRVALPLACALSAWFAAPAAAQAVPWQATGDGIAQPLTAEPGNAQRGRAIVASRQQGLCLLCHSGPIPEERFQGNLAPTLDGAGKRLTAAQLRLRMADSRQVNPDSLMPPYHHTNGLAQVGRAFAGQPILSAQQIEDVVAYLVTLQ